MFEKNIYDDYIRAIEEGLMKLGKDLKQDYLKLKPYNSSIINLDSIEDCVASLCSTDEEIKVELDLGKACVLSESITKDLLAFYDDNSMELMSELEKSLIGVERFGNKHVKLSELTAYYVLSRNNETKTKETNGYISKIKQIIDTAKEKKKEKLYERGIRLNDHLNSFDIVELQGISSERDGTHMVNYTVNGTRKDISITQINKNLYKRDKEIRKNRILGIF